MSDSDGAQEVTVVFPSTGRVDVTGFRPPDLPVPGRLL